MPLSAILDAATPASAGRQSSPTDPAVRRRYREIYARLERAGAALDTAQAVASLAIHLEQHRHARIEQPELVCLCATVSLIERTMAERGEREQGILEAVACPT